MTEGEGTALATEDYMPTIPDDEWLASRELRKRNGVVERKVQ